MISAILFISFFVFLILGLPIAICLGLSSVCAILYSGTSLTIVATNMYSGISKFLLLAIPFFCSVRKHYGKSRYFQTTDQLRRYLRRT